MQSPNPRPQTPDPAVDSAELEFAIPPEHAGKRLDVAIAACDPRISRTHCARLLKAGDILVDGKQAKASHKARGGERVAIDLPEPEEIEARPENIPLDVLFEDKDIVVVNKPAGMV